MKDSISAGFDKFPKTMDEYNLRFSPKLHELGEYINQCMENNIHGNSNGEQRTLQNIADRLEEMLGYNPIKCL